jgi:hypothetical protein
LRWRNWEEFMGYIILGVFIAFVLGCFGSFMGGMIHGKKILAAEYAEDQRRREKSEKEFREIKGEIKQEVFGNAEKQKADMAGHRNAVDRFADINSRLWNNAKNSNRP